VCADSKHNREYYRNMFAAAVLVLMAMHGVHAIVPPLRCETPAACRCTLPGTGAIDEHWNGQCNMCSILGISSDCPAETQWDPVSFQIGFWAPHSADVTAETVAVVKILTPGTDVANPHLLVRGFNTPTLQGCGRSTYPTEANDHNFNDDHINDATFVRARRDTWAATQASWDWGDNGVFTARTTPCAPGERIWFFLVNVQASRLETNPGTPVQLFFEMKTASGLYVSKPNVLPRENVLLREMTMNAGTASQFNTRSLYPIHTARALPFAVVMSLKLFDIRFDRHNFATDATVLSGREFTSVAISVPGETNCIVQGMNGVVIDLQMSAQCGGITTMQQIVFGNSITVRQAPGSSGPCTFTMMEVCRAGWETFNSVSCRQCLPGHVKQQSGAGQCTPCLTQTFMNHAGQTECYPCRNNQGTAATTCVQCHPLQEAMPGIVPTDCQCSTGHFLAVVGAVCEQCPLGKYKDAVSNRACTDCQPGKYGDTTGAITETLCTTCLSDISMQSSAAGSVHISSCLCTAGHQASNILNACEKCPTGTSKNAAGNLACTTCNSISIATGLGSLYCTPCAPGEKAMSDNTVCEAGCSSNAGLSATGDACLCNKGYTGINAESCTQCAAGKYKNTAGNNACTPCANGKHLTSLGAVSDICEFCASGSFPTIILAATACTTCPSGSTAVQSTNFGIANCQCPAGHTGNAAAGATCTQCPAGSFKTGVGPLVCTLCEDGKFSASTASVTNTCNTCASDSYPTTNRAGCIPCPIGSTAVQGTNFGIANCECPAGKVAGAGAACVCAVGFGQHAGTGACTLCAHPFYKWEIGNVACTECVLPSILNATAKTCDDPANVQVTQEVILKAGKNYISFYVFRENTRVVDLFNQDKQEWTSAQLFMKSKDGNEDFQTTESQTSFDFRQRLHHRLDVYILTIQTSNTIPNPKLRYTGKQVEKLVDIKLVVSDDIWLPTLFASPVNNREVMPIRALCSTTQCHELTYQLNDKVIFFPTKVTDIMTSTTQASGMWNQRANTQPGNVMRLSIKPHGSRPAGTGTINAQIDRTQMNWQRLTYLDTQSEVRSSGVALITTPEMIAVTHRRLLAIAPQTLPQHCPTNQAAGCGCIMSDGSVLNWPLDDCNSCVQRAVPGVCDNMGADLDDAALTFYVRINPPTNIVINVNAATKVSNVIGVAKLKRSFPFQNGTTSGVQYEHINIRSYKFAYCAGCRSSSDGVESWSDTFCGSCLESNKLFLFSLPVQLTTAELKNDNDATALTVNFEFAIDGKLYVTDNSELARKRNVLGGLTGLTDVNTYLQKTFAIVPKQFEIICPRVYGLLHSASASACPFEGALPATILIRPSTVSELPANAANYDVTDPEFRIRQTVIGSVRSTAQSERFFYTIRSMPGIVTYVRVDLANFETCQRQAVWKTSGNKTCNPDAAPVDRLSSFHCGESAKYVTRPLQQTDVLFITHLSGLRGVLSTETYDRTRSLSSTKVFALNGEKQSIEIELLLDDVECKSSENQVTIRLDRTAPVIAAVDRFIDIDSSVAVCRENSPSNCACEMPDSPNPHTPNPTIQFPWPLDECNGCVLLKNAGICNGMGAQFDAEIGITYNLYIQNKDVTGTSVLVGKLKKSKPYNPADPTQGGVEYEHLSIRGITKSECMGCFTAMDRATPQWGTSVCNTCAVHLRIFFFTVRMSTTIGEIANTPELSLTVNFEVWIDGVIYATDTTKPMSTIPNANGPPRTIHNSFNTLSTPVVWPQKINVHEKLFDLVCPVQGRYNCPFEGDATANLLLQSSVANGELDGTHHYTFRTMVDKGLHFKILAFKLSLCAVPGTLYTYCEPDHAEYEEAVAYGVCNDDNKYEILPRPQTDKLVIKFYSAQSGTETYTALPSAETHPVKEWTMTGAGDRLEVQFTTDGNTCNGDDFSIRLLVSTSPIADTVCDAGTVGPLNGPCVNCKAGEYNAIPGSATCSICPSNSTSIVGSSAISACTCKAGFQKQNAAGGVSFTCAFGGMECAPGSTGAGGGQCELCETGKYKNFLGSGVCQACPVGSSGPDTGGIDPKCKPCGTSEDAMAVGSAACVCIPGFTRSGLVCLACPSGTAKNGHGDAACTQCNADGAMNYVANTNRTQCECSQGHTGANCVQCAPRTYKESTGAAACSDCPNDRTSIVGSIGAEACVCDVGFAGTNLVCTVCGPGTYKSMIGNRVCTACTPNSMSPAQSTSEDSCVCIAAQGWSPSTTSTMRACVQSIEITEKIFQVPVSLNAFISNTNGVRTTFKTELAKAYAVTVHNVTLRYFATGTTEPVYEGRRRRALLFVHTNTGQSQIESCIVKARISTFTSIPLPTDAFVISELGRIMQGIVFHTSVASLPNNTGFLFDLSLLWFIVFLVLVCMCLICSIALLFVCCCGNRRAYEGEWESGGESEDNVGRARVVRGPRRYTRPHEYEYVRG